ncbi:hypothetical protein Tco_0130114, partial [Tanacetum coccineum]
FMMWDEMAWEFDRNLVDTMEVPMITVVTSCRVSQFRDFQPSASPTTHYYFFPDIPKVERSRDE